MLTDLVTAPSRAMARVANAERPHRAGGLALIAQGLLSAALLAWLAIDGHAPSGPLVVPIPRADYYAAEALFVLPVRALMALAFALASRSLARALGGHGALGASFGTGALALAVPNVALWVVPDLVVYGAAGFDALAPAMRFYVPLSLAWTVSLAVVAVRATHGLSLPRAVAAAFAGLAAQALVGAPLLR
ncbi:MAG: hypothetical protein KF901_20330 [Myxococcales bacterium]|nr:hypothetical protein [Myxococcales bacterium]